MGGTCSMHRQRRSSSPSWGGIERSHLEINTNTTSGKTCHRSLRHSVVSAIPDCSIANLYPLEDNYVNSEDNNNLRSPKTLAELCTDEVCRSLPYLNGELPAGLPQDIVDEIVHSLIKHSALNKTTLRALKNCELGVLSLAGCRGVTDEWLKPLSDRTLITTTSHTSSSQHSCPNSPQQHHLSPSSTLATAVGDHCIMMDMDSNHSNNIPTQEIFYGTFDNYDHHHHHHNHHHRDPPHSPGCAEYKEAYETEVHEGARDDINIGSSSSCCSTSSFVSATSNLYGEHHHHCISNENSSSPLMTTNHSKMSLEDDMVLEHNNNDDNSKIRASTTPPLLPTSPKSPPTPSDMMLSAPSLSSTPYYDDSHLQQQFSCSVTANLTLLDLRGSQRLTDKGLLQLTELGSLEVARFDNCHSLVGRGLLALASSHKLHTLSLANCRRLTDEAIINISHLISLEALSVDGCRCLTDRSLMAISQLYQLRKLDLSQCDLITDSGLEHLENLEFIEELSLGWCRSITNDGLNALTLQPRRSNELRVLRLARCVLSDDGVSYLARLTSLEELDLNGCSSIGSSALGKTLERLTNLTTLDVSYCPGILRSSWQGKIKNLRSLELCYSGVKDSDLAKLTDLPHLEELNLDSCLTNDWAIAHLADNNVVPNLKSLDLADTELTDMGMVHLPKFKNLTRLSLFYCNITNSGLLHVAQLTNLEVLNLDSREISDEGLRHLRNLKLRFLDVFSGRVTDIGCEHLSHIKSLESLELCGGCVGDAGCSYLATLTNLTSLNLSQNERITNRGAAALAKGLTNLKALNLSNTRVNVAALRFLVGGLMKLQSLALYGCRGIDNDVGVHNLQNGLPSLKCLRLNTTADEDGMIVSTGEEVEDDDIDDEIVHHLQHQESSSGRYSGARDNGNDRQLNPDVSSSIASGNSNSHSTGIGVMFNIPAAGGGDDGDSNDHNNYRHGYEDSQMDDADDDLQHHGDDVGSQYSDQD